MSDIERFARPGVTRARAVVHDGRVYTVSTSPVKSDSMEEQARHAMKQLETHLIEAGSSKSRLLTVTVYIADMARKAEQVDRVEKAERKAGDGAAGAKAAYEMAELRWKQTRELTLCDGEECKPGSFFSKHVMLRIFGWLLTALAVSLGASFWFDKLGKLFSIRGSGQAAGKPAA